MFDVSFSELIVIGVVALVVIGPERLPRVARTVGHLLGRAQRYVNDVKADIHREIQLDELKKLQSQLAESAQTIGDSVQQEIESARAAFVSPAHAALAELETTHHEILAEAAPESTTPALTPPTDANAQKPTA